MKEIRLMFVALWEGLPGLLLLALLVLLAFTLGRIE
jgi:hypothetical protein